MAVRHPGAPNDGVVVRKSVLVSLAVALVAVIVVAGALIWSGNDDDKPAGGSGGTSTAGDAGITVRDDSARLSEGGKATFVEFLDFECEACASLYPVVEDLRTQFGDDVTFVVRHMPLHTSSENAARAAEAAAEQGKFTEMYHRLFETQPDWGHAAEPEKDAFFALAEELDLDMAKFEADFEGAVVAERIEGSKADALELGVQGTPTFFLDGEKLEPETIDDLEEAIRDAIK